MAQLNQDSTTVKAAAGQIYYLTACNTNAGAARYLKLYDNNNPTSSNTPVFTLLIPPNNSGFEQPIPVGISFYALRVEWPIRIRPRRRRKRLRD